MRKHDSSAVYFECDGRRLYTTTHTPTHATPVGSVLHVPAFGEEMNKSRAVVSKQARILADMGYQVTIVDPYGTGDSEGEFVEASWEMWCGDVVRCSNWVAAESGHAPVLWGLRLGALLAADVAAVMDTGRSHNQPLLLWHPVLNGEQHMTQFLRLRLANSVMHGGQKEKASDLKALIEREGQLEIAGYEISRELFTETSFRKLAALPIGSDQCVVWVDVLPPDRPAPLPTQKLLEQWQSNGIECDYQQVAGPQFWSTQELSEGDELIRATTARFESLRHGNDRRD